MSKGLRIFLALIGGIAALFAIWQFPIRSCTLEHSYNREVLQELNYGRDILAYVLVCRDMNWRIPANFNLVHMSRVAGLFAHDPALRNDVRNLYEKMSASMEHAKELRSLLAQESADPEVIKNYEIAIDKTVKLADEVGPRIAQQIGGTWNIPPPNTPVNELVRYYSIITSAPSDYVAPQHKR